jgi:hypothetical protein
MSDRITIRQAGGAPQPREWAEDGPPVIPAQSAPDFHHQGTEQATEHLTVIYNDKPAMRDLTNETQHWTPMIGGGLSSRDRFTQKWVAKHTEE